MPWDGTLRPAGKAAAADQTLRPPSEGEWAGRLSRSNGNPARTRPAARALSQLDTVGIPGVRRLRRWLGGTLSRSTSTAAVNSSGDAA